MDDFASVQREISANWSIIVALLQSEFSAGSDVFYGTVDELPIFGDCWQSLKFHAVGVVASMGKIFSFCGCCLFGG